MSQTFRGPLTVLARLMLCALFFLSAVRDKINYFGYTADYMGMKGVPAPHVLLVGAILFLIVGSVLVVVGYKARLGAVLLLVFLTLATYYYYDFWNAGADERQWQINQFLVNLSLMGAMLLILINGAGPMSLDSCTAKQPAHHEEPVPAG
jgi:putative oxidoreductase